MGKFAQARHYKRFGALRNLLLVMAQIAQLVLASVALLVVLQTCQAQQGYVGKVVRASASTLYYALLHFLCACSVCYQLRSWLQSYRASRTLSYTDYYQCWWSRCSRYRKFLSREKVVGLLNTKHLTSQQNAQNQIPPVL